MQVHRLPGRTDPFEDEGHAARSRIWLAAKCLALSPETSDDGAVASHHDDVLVANFELYVFHLRIRRFAILVHLVPTAGYRAVVVEKN